MAELELRNAARRIRGGAEGLFGRSSPQSDDLPPPPPPRDGPTATATASEPPEIRRFYANLELPVGASAEEVKAAYRRLMRRYHPDRHATDPERAQVANQVAQQLRTAYEGLLAYLGKGVG